MAKRLKLNWHRSINFGDQLNPYLVKKIWGLDSIKINEGEFQNHLMMIGSILNEANSNSLVFGSGFVSPDSFFIGDPKILSVRGELTREVLRKRGYPESEIKIGDPAILIPDFYIPNVSDKKFKLGVIPHIIDYDLAVNFFSNLKDCTIIDLRLPGEDENKEVEKIIDQMCNCDHIISSSLHGLIIAHSYGIPAAWCEFSNRVIGDGFKFKDYFSAHTSNWDKIPRINLKESRKINYIDHLIEESKNYMIETNKDKDQVYEIIRNIGSLLVHKNIIY